MSETVLAVDVGGTKIAAGVVDRDGNLLRSASVPTPRQDDPEAVFTALLGAVRRAEPAGALALGVGCAGPMTAGGETVSPLNIAGWRGFPLLSRLQKSLDLPVVVDGDAKALAVGEGWKGAGAGVASFLAMVVSTGVGGGLVVDGRLLHGADGNAGHVGHVVVVPDGAVCGCGGRGCLEAEMSGTAIARRTGAPAQKAPLPEVLRAGKLLGQGLASVVNLLDLELVAIGGSVALGYGGPFFSAVSRGLHTTSRLGFTQDCRIEPVGLGADGPLIGAGALAWQQLGHDVGTR
ncbi:MAG: putative sugar kinase [Frankiales bacterium]|nr:putative sugar kinase [Frankiales bacterium]